MGFAEEIQIPPYSEIFASHDDYSNLLRFLHSKFRLMVLLLSLFRVLRGGSGNVEFSSDVLSSLSGFMMVNKLFSFLLPDIYKTWMSLLLWLKNAISYFTDLSFPSILFSSSSYSSFSSSFSNQIFMLVSKILVFCNKLLSGLCKCYAREEDKNIFTSSRQSSVSFSAFIPFMVRSIEYSSFFSNVFYQVSINILSVLRSSSLSSSSLFTSSISSPSSLDLHLFSSDTYSSFLTLHFFLQAFSFLTSSLLPFIKTIIHLISFIHVSTRTLCITSSSSPINGSINNNDTNSSNGSDIISINNENISLSFFLDSAATFTYNALISFYNPVLGVFIMYIYIFRVHFSILFCLPNNKHSICVCLSIK
jgi:hypothetical protein